MISSVIEKINPENDWMNQSLIEEPEIAKLIVTTVPIEVCYGSSDHIAARLDQSIPASFSTGEGPTINRL
ncbi:MAG: hypothetical protein ABFS39_13175 [Pseudomonadota bacterium]